MSKFGKIHTELSFCIFQMSKFTKTM